jgi:hypothetical protein
LIAVVSGNIDDEAAVAQPCPVMPVARGLFLARAAPQPYQVGELLVEKGVSQKIPSMHWKKGEPAADSSLAKIH